MNAVDDQLSSNRAAIRHLFLVVLPDPLASAVFDDLVDAAYVDHDPAVPGHAHGVESLRATHADLHRRFPGNVNFSIDDMVAERDIVAVRWSAGPAQAMAWFRLSGGKVTDRWAMVRHVE